MTHKENILLLTIAVFISINFFDFNIWILIGNVIGIVIINTGLFCRLKNITQRTP